jgi:hypothetical protein
MIKLVVIKYFVKALKLSKIKILHKLVKCLKKKDKTQRFS